MKRLSSLWLLPLVLAFGCSATVGGFGEEIGGSGDSDQDVMEIIQGPGFIWNGDVKELEREDGSTILVPTGTGAGVFCETSDCQARWVTNAQTNADRDAKINEIWRDGMLQAVETGVKAASPAP